MINFESIKTAWSGLVGFRQSRDMSNKIKRFFTSSSGVWFDGGHPLVTHDNLRALMAENSRYTYSAWDSGTAYVVDDIVTKGGSTWICIQAGTNQDPESASSEYWILYDSYTEFLADHIEDSIIETVNTWINIQGESKLLEEYKDMGILFKGSPGNGYLDTSNLKFRGLRINPRRSTFLKTKIHRIGLSFNDSWDCNLALFKTGAQEPVKTKTITYPGTGGTSLDELWTDVSSEDWILDGSGSYFLGYLDDNSAQSVNTRYSSIPADRVISDFCSSNFLDVYGFNSDGDGSTLWDVRSTSVTLATNYGINIEYSIYCDFTELFTNNKGKFATALQKCFARKAVQLMHYNPNNRENRTKLNVGSFDLEFELHGDNQGRPSGLNHEFRQALKNLSIEFGSVDQYCIPCAKRGVTYKKM